MGFRQKYLSCEELFCYLDTVPQMFGYCLHTIIMQKLKVAIHKNQSSINSSIQCFFPPIKSCFLSKGCHTLKVIFYKRLYYIRICLISMVASNMCCHPLKLVFHQRLISVLGCLPLKVIAYRGLSFKSCLSFKFVFY